jgi:hypothetical protein
VIGRAAIRAFIAAALLISSPAAAESARDLLTSAAFATSDRAAALAKVEAALREANATLARKPKDHEALLQQAIAIGYRGKLKRSPADAKAARRAFEALVAARPRDPEAQLAIGGWHLAAIVEIGPLLARTVLGARKGPGIQSVDRAVALGGGRALFPAYASMLRIRLDPNDVATARRLAEAATKARAPTTLDRIMQRHAAAVLVPLRAGNGKAAAALAKKLSPFGRIAD